MNSVNRNHDSKSMSDSAIVTMPLQWLAACVASSQNVTLCHLWCIGLTKQSHYAVNTQYHRYSSGCALNTHHTQHDCSCNHCGDRGKVGRTCLHGSDCYTTENHVHGWSLVFRFGGVEPQLKSSLAHFSFRIWHLVATVFMIFMINLPSFVQFKQY